MRFKALLLAVGACLPVCTASAAPASPAIESANLWSLASGAKSASTTPREKNRVREILMRVKDERDKVSPALLSSLAAIGTHDAMKALAECIDMLKQPKTLRAACDAMTRFDADPKLRRSSLSALAKAADDSLPSRRRSATRALAQVGEEAFPALRKIIRKSRDERVNAFATKGLLPELMQANSKDDLSLLCQHYRVGVSGSREELSAALTEYRDKELLGTLYNELTNEDAQTSTVLTAIENLGARKDPASLETLLKLVRTKNNRIVFAGLKALQQRNEDDFEGKIHSLLSSKDPAVVREAIVVISQLAMSDPDWHEEVMDRARSKKPVARATSAAALAQLRLPESVELLDQLSQDSEYSVRSEAIAALGSVRSPAVIPVLIRRLGSESGPLHRDVYTCLRLVTGEDFGGHPSRWNNWWVKEGQTKPLPTYEEALAKESTRSRAKSGEKRTKASFYGLRILSKRVCFVVDISGSMLTKTSSGKNRLQAAKEELIKALESLPEGTHFNILFFSSDVFAWQDELVKANERNLEEARDFIDRHQPAGSTAIYDALSYAFEDTQIDTLYVLSDGEPAGGSVDNVDDIRAEVARWNSLRHVQINGIVIGTFRNLLDGLAKDSGGSVIQVR